MVDHILSLRSQQNDWLKLLTERNATHEIAPSRNRGQFNERRLRGNLLASRQDGLPSGVREMRKKFGRKKTGVISDVDRYSSRYYSRHYFSSPLRKQRHLHNLRAKGLNIGALNPATTKETSLVDSVCSFAVGFCGLPSKYKKKLSHGRLSTWSFWTGHSLSSHYRRGKLAKKIQYVLILCVGSRIRSAAPSPVNFFYSST
jgi:hypothetical protein